MPSRGICLPTEWAAQADSSFLSTPQHRLAHFQDRRHELQFLMGQSLTQQALHSLVGGSTACLRAKGFHDGLKPEQHSLLEEVGIVNQNRRCHVPQRAHRIPLPLCGHVSAAHFQQVRGFLLEFCQDLLNQRRFNLLQFLIERKARSRCFQVVLEKQQFFVTGVSTIRFSAEGVKVLQHGGIP